MNLNESCLLSFLINPDEIRELSEIFVKNIEEIEKRMKISDNIWLLSEILWIKYLIFYTDTDMTFYAFLYL